MNGHSSASAKNHRQRLRLDLTGAVQGVGFRPFIHRLAAGEGLTGFVRNTGEGVSIEVEGVMPEVERFLKRLDTEIVPPAEVHERRMDWLPVQGERTFTIMPSARISACSAVVLADLASCSECVEEIFDPDNRRHLYPFTTCVRCGPRYSIVEAMPYDRVRTTMRHFTMCAACQAEYDNPDSRRFHAQTNACPNCGPQVALWDVAGSAVAVGPDALQRAAAALSAIGRIRGGRDGHRNLEPATRQR